MVDSTLASLHAKEQDLITARTACDEVLKLLQADKAAGIPRWHMDSWGTVAVNAVVLKSSLDKLVLVLAAAGFK